MIEEGPVSAVVQKIILDGKHGPYAIATSEHIRGSITFSLKRSVWHEGDTPEPGVRVMLSCLRKKQAGWRALSGRFERPSDESQQ